MRDARPGRRLAWAGAALAVASCAPASTPAPVATPLRAPLGAAYAPAPGCRLLATVQQRSCATWQIVACDADPAPVAAEFVAGVGPVGAGAVRRPVAVEGAAGTADGARNRAAADAAASGVAARTAASGAATAAVAAAAAGAASDAPLVGVSFERFERSAFADGGRQVAMSFAYAELLAGAPATVDLGGRPVRLAVDRSAPGATGGAFAGEVFYAPDLGAVIGWRGRMGEGPGARNADQTPVALSLPGEPGFGATWPVTPCAAGAAS